MNYELAKQLKEAGFPQEAKYGNQFYDDKENIFLIDENLEGLTWKNSVKIPTLPELIEACGDGFIELSRQGNKVWIAKGLIMDDEQHIVITMNSKPPEGSPEEAVAKLWLKLNKS